ncbi:MAG: ribosome small subunit-dependent GTPase A [Bacteroidales bacterium]
MQGIVIKNTGNWYEIADESQKIFLCKVKGNFRLKEVKTTNPVAVGDHVDFELLTENQDFTTQKFSTGWITAVHERQNCLIRKSVNLSKQTHIIAANIDMAFIVVSMHHPRTPQGFIDRFLVSCEAYRVPCSLIFNKIDTYNPQALKDAALYKALYEAIGYRCLYTSAVTLEGLDILKEYMQNKVCLFAGNSGVGKSALVHAIEPSLEIKIGEISCVHNKGKHTTTYAQMYPLSFQGYIMDTPGIKEFGMVKLNTEEISRYFPEMKLRMDACQFNNCTHEHEPNCAIKKAVENGDIHPLRYKSYLNILHGREVDTPGLLENKKESKK